MNSETKIEVMPASQYHRKAKGTVVLVDGQLRDHLKGPGHQQRADALAASLRALREPRHGCGHMQGRGAA